MPSVLSGVGEYISKQKGEAAMKTIFSILSLVLIFAFVAGCASPTSQESIFCDPPKADIYWGKTEGNLQKTGLTTPHSRSISASKLESWCYQVRKEGYHDSEIVCREEEGFRYLEFRLTSIETSITSEPSGAIVYWGQRKDQMEETYHRTPTTITSKEPSALGGAAWDDWYFQVKKEGYRDSEIIFLQRQQHDRSIHFELIPLPREFQQVFE